MASCKFVFIFKFWRQTETEMQVMMSFYVRVCSDRMYSPMSAWWKQTMPMGSECRHSAVDFAATPKPRGKSDMEQTMTPVYFSVFSVIRPRPPLVTLCPYRNCCSAVAFNLKLMRLDSNIESKSLNNTLFKHHRNIIFIKNF